MITTRAWLCRQNPSGRDRAAALLVIRAHSLADFVANPAHELIPGWKIVGTMLAEILVAGAGR
jgi:hypothetical protein